MNEIKYPRTFHFPWSLGMTNDDKMLSSLSVFIGKQIVVTEKKDGENSTLCPTRCYARSIDSSHHESRAWLKQFWGTIKHEIPKNWRICGENVFAKHSISYTELETYFYGFSVWNETNVCLSWEETNEWFSLLGITPVPVLYEGIFDEDVLRYLVKSMDLTKQEGYVARLAGEIHYDDFATSFGKFVRKGHVADNAKHWKTQPVIQNQLKVK